MVTTMLWCTEISNTSSLADQGSPSQPTLPMELKTACHPPASHSTPRTMFRYRSGQILSLIHSTDLPSHCYSTNQRAEYLLDFLSQHLLALQFLRKRTTFHSYCECSKSLTGTYIQICLYPSTTNSFRPLFFSFFFCFFVSLFFLIKKGGRRRAKTR